MRRGMMILLTALLATWLPAATGASAAPEAAADSSHIRALIDRLNDADSTVRLRAADDLVQIGLPARPELIAASRSDDPEVRARAAQILRKLPWDVPSDPPAVRALLRRYGTGSDAVRNEIIQQIGRIDAGTPTLLRLLHEEPADGVRWTIALELASNGARDAEILDQVRNTRWLATSDDPPALLLLGQAWMDRDHGQALKYLRRAIDADEARPSDDPGLLAFAYETLTDDAMKRGHFDEAAALLRRQLPEETRGWWRRHLGNFSPEDFDGSASRADLPVLPRLMAIHQLLGPLDRYEFDVRTWGRSRPAPPSLMRGIVFLFARLGAAPPVVCRAMDLSGEDHFSAAVFMLRNDMPVAAGLEADAAMASPRKRRPDTLEANVAFLRAELALRRGDDAGAADLLEHGLQIRADSRFRQIPENEDDVWAQVQFLRAKAALKRGETKTVDARIHDLEQLDLGNTDLAITIVNWLKDNHRPEAAKVVFDRIYAQAKARLAAPDNDLGAGLQNDLAWLCARSGEKLDEALRLAQSAVASSPHNPAFLDTLAEAQFRSGQKAAAIESESKALAMSPENAFMKGQLARFRK